MTKKKNRCWTFCFSFIPGAGEMYMGFMKMGISLMSLFVLVLFLAFSFNMPALLLIDVVVSTTLMSMGMIMLPPAMISMPFKLLLFISIDGWQLLFSNLVRGFN